MIDLLKPINDICNVAQFESRAIRMTHHYNVAQLFTGVTLAGASQPNFSALGSDSPSWNINAGAANRFSH